MKWQAFDWFFVAIFVVLVLVSVTMYYFGRGRHSTHRGDGKSDGRPPRAEEEEHEHQGPTINM